MCHFPVGDVPRPASDEILVTIHPLEGAIGCMGHLPSGWLSLRAGGVVIVVGYGGATPA